MRWRAAKIGAATVTGGVLLAVTGGLAAPALAAALATVGATTVVTTLASSVTVVATLFGVGGAARAGLAMQRRTAGISEFEIMRPKRLPMPPSKDVSAEGSAAAVEAGDAATRTTKQEDEEVRVSSWVGAKVGERDGENTRVLER